MKWRYINWPLLGVFLVLDVIMALLVVALFGFNWWILMLNPLAAVVGVVAAKLGYFVLRYDVIEQDKGAHDEIR